MTCDEPGCGAQLSDHLRYCTGCGKDFDCPNVRAANSADERRTLALRYEAAHLDSKTSGYEEDFLDYIKACSQSRAVMCMSLPKLHTIVGEPTKMFGTWAREINAGLRMPVSNQWDPARTSVEQAFFPSYAADIHFAALSLSGEGQSAYGECSISFKDVSISRRATVFDSPLFSFAKEHHVTLGSQIPPGHRAIWEERGLLAGVKIGSGIKGVDKQKYPELLLPRPTDTGSDCIEVHIYGSLQIASVEGVFIRNPKRPADRILKRSIVQRLKSSGINARVEP